MSGEGVGLPVEGLPVVLPKPSTPTSSPTPTPRATISTAYIARQTYTPYTAEWRADTFKDDS